MNALSKQAILSLLGFFAISVFAQDQSSTLPPEMQALRDESPNWPVISPGDQSVNLRKFLNLRAVYERRNNIGSQREDRTETVYQYQPTTWGGNEAMLTIWTSSGDKTKAWANARVMYDIVDLESFQHYFGTSYWNRDLDVKQYFPERSVAFSVSNVFELSDVSTVQGEYSVFPVNLTRAQIISALDFFEPGKKFRLTARVREDKTVHTVAVHIAGKTTVEDVHGDKHEVWDVQSVPSATGMIMHYYISEQPPYFIGFLARNELTGRKFVEVIYHSHIVMNHME